MMPSSDSLDYCQHPQRSFVYPVPRRRPEYASFDETTTIMEDSSSRSSEGLDFSLDDVEPTTTSTNCSVAPSKDTNSKHTCKGYFLPGITSPPRCLSPSTGIRKPVANISMPERKAKQHHSDEHHKIKHSYHSPYPHSSPTPPMSHVLHGIRVDRLHVDQERVALLRMQCELDDLLQNIVNKHKKEQS